MEKAKKLLEEIINLLVDNPEAVKIEVKQDEMGVLFTLNVAKADMGQVIGKKGETATAIRHLLRIVGLRDKAHINLKIAEPEGYGRPEGYSRDESNAGHSF